MINRFFVFLFIAILLVPGVSLLFLKKIELKRITDVSIYKKLEKISVYLSVKLFQKKIAGNVHLGRSGYLFYLPKDDGNLWQDLYGDPSLNFDDVIKEWGEKFQQFNKDKYFFILAPNKERVLQNYLDLFVKPDFNKGTRYFDIFPRLENVIDAAKFLQEEDYFLSDTHWNNLGAKKIAEILLDKMHADFKFGPTTIVDIYREGDITRMLNGPVTFYPPLNKENDIKLDFSKVKQTLKSEDLSIFENLDQTRKLSVLLVGDSFRDLLAPILALGVKKLTVSKVTNDNFLKSISPEDFDFVFEVRVERNLRYVKKLTFRNP